MNKQVVIIGASIGGLIAAAELKQRGFGVTIIERGNTVGGLYSKVETPFGWQELGMHVLYLAEPHYQHLRKIVGDERLQIWRGVKVDIGGAFNAGTMHLNSIYPDVRNSPFCQEIINQLKANAHPESNALCENNAHHKITSSCVNAKTAAQARFGVLATQEYVSPILQKLWQMPSELLSAGALHCFYDLRRIVACNKKQADELKQDPVLDKVIANPEQQQPAGEVFGGRLAARFTQNCDDLSDVALQWLKAQQVSVHFNSAVSIGKGALLFNGASLASQYDACIVASPLAGLMPGARSEMEFRELSIYYFQLDKNISTAVPAYYLLCHDSTMLSARIVNYAAYQQEQRDSETCVIAVEVLHLVGAAPAESAIAQEVHRVFPAVAILASYSLPHRLPVPIPSLANAILLDSFTEQLKNNNAGMPLYFSGMRTDQGLFFSHHTIGHAYDSALECAATLP